MKDAYQNVYQFKITLKHSKPAIWRRIQVPETYSFWDLHVAIQDAMGWDDCHLHEFMVPTQKDREAEIGLPGVSGILNGSKVKMTKYFQREGDKADYWYDFGDDWMHLVVLEKIMPRDPKQEYPRCLAGKMACPPEDCGGIWGYYEMLDILKDPSHPEYEDYSDWLGDDFDPSDFDPEEVVFDDPKQRWKMAMAYMV